MRDVHWLMKEVEFLAGVFFNLEIPREKNYIFKYFRSPLEKQFVRYYLCFEEIEYFTPHTGYRCQLRWLKELKKRFDYITQYHRTCKFNMDLDLLKKIEDGKCKFIKEKYDLDRE